MFVDSFFNAHRLRRFLAVAVVWLAWSGATQALTPGESQWVVNQARAYIAEGKLSEAFALAEAMIASDPSNPEAYYHAGTIYLFGGQAQRGLDYMRRSAELAPDNFPLRLILGQSLERSGRFDEAMEEYRRIIASAPHTPQGKEADKRVKILQGRRLGESGERERALQIFISLAQDYPDDPGVLTDLGLTYVLLNRLTEAQTVLEKAVQLQPGNDKAQRLLADVYDKLGNLQGARMHYEEVLKLIPPNAPSAAQARAKLRVVTGLERLAANDYLAASEIFTEILKEEPDNLAIRLNLATAYRGAGKFEEAETELKKILEREPRNAESLLRLGALYVEMNRPEEAARRFEDVLTVERDSSRAEQAARFLSKIYGTEQGRILQARIVDERIADFKRRIAENPDNLAAHRGLAFIYLNQRRNEEALKAFQEVLRLAPDDLLTRETVARLLDDTGKFEEAVKAFTEVINQEKNPAVLESLRAQLKFLLAKKAFFDRQYDSAEQQFKTLIEENAADPIPHFFMALIRARQDKLDEALAEYREVLRLAPGHFGARMNLAGLYEQMGREEDALEEYTAAVRMAPADALAEAERRLSALRKRIGGFSGGLGYSFQWDSNSNYDDRVPDEEFIGDLSATLNYQYKLHGKPLTWGMTLSPSYSVYHRGQFDFMRLSATPFLLYNLDKERSLSANVTHSEIHGVLRDEVVNTSDTLALDVSRRLGMRSLLGFLIPSGDDKLFSVARLNANYRVFKSDASPIYDADTYSLGGSFSQNLGNGWSWYAAYTYTDNRNRWESGNDFAYRSHGLFVQASTSWTSSLSGNVGYSYSNIRYVNPDSATKFEEKRRNQTHSVSTSVNYQFNDELRFYGSYTFQFNDSNLPTGFLLNREDVGQIVGVQSPSLGDYQKHLLEMGIGISF